MKQIKVDSYCVKAYKKAPNVWEDEFNQDNKRV